MPPVPQPPMETPSLPPMEKAVPPRPGPSQPPPREHVSWDGVGERVERDEATP